jgi:drug/metabolite transporter (DMT)-like permease
VLVGLVAGLLAALLYGAPAALQAHASRRLPEGPWWRVALAGVRDRLMLAVVLLYGLGAAAQYVAIQHLPLYLAQAAIAGSLLFTALAAAWFLHEWPAAPEWLALGSVCGGLGLLALAAGPAGGHRVDPGFVPGLYGGCAALALAAVALRRVRGGHGGALMGLLSGTAYAGVPIGARVLVAPYLRWETVSVGGAVALLGLLGFVLYSIALQRAPVNASSAPLILSQTALPAILGIALFHDGIRSGWAWVVVVGLALSMVGTVAVSALTPPLLDLVAEASPDTGSGTAAATETVDP